MTNTFSMKNIVWIAAITLAFLAISAIPAHAQYYQYNVPFFGDFSPEPAYANYNPTYYPPNYYYPPSYSYTPLSVSCMASPTSLYAGMSTTWTAYVSGGSGLYSYSWFGDENMSGSGRTVSKTYYNPGTKRASVTVQSGGYTVTQSCGNYVNVSQYYYPTPTYTYPYPTYTYPYSQSSNLGLDVGCYADPSNAKINQPITWLVEVTGGLAPYTYAWTGSDGLSGSQSSIVKYYATSGSKSAIVTVTSADGRTMSRACSNQVTVASAYKAPARPVYKAPALPVMASPTPAVTPSPAPAQVQTVTGGAFSLSYVPWGWVAVLVILVLFATVLYLLFNREKI